MNRKWILLFSIFLLALDACSSAGKKLPENQLKEDGEPSLLSPQIRRMWVPDKIEADQYIKGHYIYFIEKGAQWKAQ